MWLENILLKVTQKEQKNVFNTIYKIVTAVTNQVNPAKVETRIIATVVT